MLLYSVLPLLFSLATTAAPAPLKHSPSKTTSAPSSTPTVPYASDNPNYPLWNLDEDIIPEAIRGKLGASILGPMNVPLELENTDALASPSTDHGSV